MRPRPTSNGMDFLSKYNLTPGKVVKTVLIGIGVLIALVFVAKLANLPMGGRGFSMQGVPSIAPSYGGNMYYAEDSVSYDNAGLRKELSIRNVLPILPPRPGGTTGSDAEAYEVTDYNARIETRSSEKTCAIIREWKALEYVIFENANESERQCYFTFKVEHEHAAHILGEVKALDPKDLTENIQTIKQQVEDFTSQTEILEKKRDSIDQTLTSALRSYDEISSIATRTQNAEALAKIIDSKIGIIERLTQERININAQLDGLARAKNQQLDRLKYTYFNVSVYENKFFDGENLSDSWKQAVQDFVRTLNVALQAVTLGLVGFLIWLLPIIVYAAVVLIVAKYGWRAIRYIWAK